VDNVLNQDERPAPLCADVLTASYGILNAAGEELFRVVLCDADGHQNSVVVVGR
jgi:hypothetical protein